ncbi:MAG: CinA family protein [Oscillospiraceae bacterium]|nr:CinA family protein [Oscillospiraceae bacterium]
MTSLASEVIKALAGKTLATAESCTGGMIGQLLTGVPGASLVYKGGVISYTNEVKQNVLGVDGEALAKFGAVSAQTAAAMASGVRKLLNTDAAVSVTGLAGPGGDEYDNAVGTVFIGFDSQRHSEVKEFHFTGDREAVRRQAAEAALKLILENV